MRIANRTFQATWLVACLLAAACGSKSGAGAVPTVDATSDVGSLADATADAVQPSDSAPPDTGKPDTAPPDTAAPDAAPTDSAGPDVADSAGTAQWYACAVAADCAAVEVMCCDHCNGGKAVAANKAFSTEVKAALGPKSCDTVACTEKGCAPVQTDCHLGKCIVAGSQCTGQIAQPARVCVRGKPLGSKEQLAVGDAIEVTVYPKGCFSSSCTKAEASSCSISATGGDVSVTATFCLLDTSDGGPCTADCSGGGFAGCKGGTWTAGSHAVSLGGQSVTVTVPGEVPAGGACAGSPF